MPRHAAAAALHVATTSDQAFEQAARAAYVAHYEYMGVNVADDEHGIAWEDLHPTIKNRFMVMTRAVLDAYNDPDKE